MNVISKSTSPILLVMSSVASHKYTHTIINTHTRVSTSHNVRTKSCLHRAKKQASISFTVHAAINIKRVSDERLRDTILTFSPV